MSLPVAGRRKGQIRGEPVERVIPIATPNDGPSWLTELNENPYAAAAPTVASPTPSSLPAFVADDATLKTHSTTMASEFPDGGAIARTTDHSSDPLAFLQNDDDNFAILPSATASSPPAVLPLPWATDVFLSSQDGGKRRQNPTAEVQPFSATPAFLLDADGSTSPMTTAATVKSGKGGLQDGGETDLDKSIKVQTLLQELLQLDELLKEAAQNVEMLKGCDHATGREVGDLESTIASLREKESSVQLQLENQQARARAAVSAVASAKVTSDTPEQALEAYRVECVQRYEGQLATVMSTLQAQRERNIVLQAEWDDALKKPKDEETLSSSAYETLFSKIQDCARHLKRQFSVRCSRVVADGAREHLAAAKRQRNEIFSMDDAKRSTILEDYRTRYNAERTSFQVERHEKLQAHADSAFGAIKAALEATHQQHLNEQQHRVAAFQSNIATMTERHRDALDQQLRRQFEQESSVAAMQSESAAREFKARLDELSGQRYTFRLRASSEIGALRETRLQDMPKGDASATVREDSHEVARAEMEHLHTRMKQLTSMARTKTQRTLASNTPPIDSHARLSMSDQGGRGGQSSYPERMAVERARESWQRSLESFQRAREALRRSVADVSECARGWRQLYVDRHSRIESQRQSVLMTRAEWEKEVRAQLSRCLTASDTQVPPSALLLSDSLERWNQQVRETARAHQTIRGVRASFTEEVRSWAQSIGTYRGKSEEVLADLFQQSELLRESSVQAEVDQLVVQSLEAQSEVLARHVEEEATKLAMKKRKLDTLIKTFSGDVLQLSSAVDSPGPSARQLVKHRHSRGRKIAFVGNSGTALRFLPADVDDDKDDIDDLWSEQHEGSATPEP